MGKFTADEDRVAKWLDRNIAAGQDVIAVKQRASDEFCKKEGLSRTLWLPARCLTRSVTGRKRRRSHLVSFSHLNIIALGDHPTFQFIQETVAQGRELRETTLYDEAIRRGQQVRRQASEGGVKIRVPLADEDQLALYRDRCLRLADSIRANGVVDVQSPEGRGFVEADGLDGNIMVTIDDGGSILHYRRGRHRLAIAAVLGLDVPAYLHSISGEVVRRFMKGRLGFGSRPLVRAIEDAKAWALDNLSRSADAFAMIAIGV